MHVGIFHIGNLMCRQYSIRRWEVSYAWCSLVASIVPDVQCIQKHACRCCDGDVDLFVKKR